LKKFHKFTVQTYHTYPKGMVYLQLHMLNLHDESLVSSSILLWIVANPLCSAACFPNSAFIFSSYTFSWSSCWWIAAFQHWQQISDMIIPLGRVLLVD